MRCILLFDAFYFISGKAKTLYKKQKRCVVYCDTIAESTIHKWFTRFRSRSFELEDQEHFSRSAITDDDQIKMLIQNNEDHMICDIAKILCISHMISIKT